MILAGPDCDPFLARSPASVAGPTHAADAHRWYTATCKHSVAGEAVQAHGACLKISSPSTAPERVRPQRASCIGELPLLSERDLQRRGATQATAAITPTSPVPLVHGRSHWQHLGDTQHHDGKQHLHGDVAGRLRRRRAVNGRIHSWKVSATSCEVGPKTKVGESKPAETMEATPASREDGIHELQLAVQYFRHKNPAGLSALSI